MQTVTVQTLAAKTPLRAKTNKKGQFCLNLFSTFHTMNCWAEIQTGLTVMGALLYEKIEIITLVGEERSNLRVAEQMPFLSLMKLKSPGLYRGPATLWLLLLFSSSLHKWMHRTMEKIPITIFPCRFFPPLESQLYLDINKMQPNLLSFMCWLLKLVS